MFSPGSNFAENRQAIVPLVEDPAYCQEYMLKHMYLLEQDPFWTAPAQLTADSAIRWAPLLVLADKYQLPELKRIAGIYYNWEVEHITDPDEIMTLVSRLSHEHSDQDFADRVRHKRLKSLFDHPPYRQWLQEDPELLAKQLYELSWMVQLEGQEIWICAKHPGQFWNEDERRRQCLACTVNPVEEEYLRRRCCYVQPVEAMDLESE